MPIKSSTNGDLERKFNQKGDGAFIEFNENIFVPLRRQCIACSRCVPKDEQNI
jgi:hypothetical protein